MHGTSIALGRDTAPGVRAGKFRLHWTRLRYVVLFSVCFLSTPLLLSYPLLPGSTCPLIYPRISQPLVLPRATLRFRWTLAAGVTQVCSVELLLWTLMRSLTSGKDGAYELAPSPHGEWGGGCLAGPGGEVGVHNAEHLLQDLQLCWGSSLHCLLIFPGN